MNNTFRNREKSKFRRRKTPEYLQLGHMPIHIRFSSEEDTNDNTSTVQQTTAPGPLSEEHFPTLEKTTKHEANMEQKTQSANTNGSPKARQVQLITKGDSDDFLEDALQVLPGMVQFEKDVMATDDGEESSPRSSDKKCTAVTPNSKSSKDSSKVKGHTRTPTKSSTATKQELDKNAATAHGAQKEKDAATKQELCNIRHH